MAASFITPNTTFLAGGSASRTPVRSADRSADRRAAATRRMYLQRRLAVLLAVVVMVVAVGVMMSAGRADATLEGNAGRTTYVVRHGDTLWSIAGATSFDGDRRDAVALLAEVNGGSELRAGQELTIPAALGIVR